MGRTSLCGRSMAQCREEFIKWLASENRVLYPNDTWANYCLRYWLYELDGMAGVW